jgi:hypothetical protein
MDAEALKPDIVNLMHKYKYDNNIDLGNLYIHHDSLSFVTFRF